MNIRANASDNTESVRFRLRDSNDRVIFARLENIVPYALFGDRGGDYVVARLQNGTYYLEATPYTENSAEGISGPTTRIRFQIQGTTRSAESISNTTESIEDVENVELAVVDVAPLDFKIYPNPVFTPEFTIEFNRQVDAPSTVQVIDPTGRVLFNQSQDFIARNLTVETGAQNLPNGLYLVRVIIDGEEPMIKKLIKQ